MAISPNEAAAALSDIERTAARSVILRNYRMAGPMLIAWGGIWLAGYGAMGLLPMRRWGAIWLALDLLGLALSIAITWRSRPAWKGRRPWRVLAATAGFVAFIVATYAVFQPKQAAIYMAYPGLLCGVAYFTLGVLGRARFAWIGAAIFGATLAGFYGMQPWLAWWMAAVGGGGLVLGGVWLRRA